MLASVIDGGDFVLVRSTGATDDATAGTVAAGRQTSASIAPTPGSVPAGSAPATSGGRLMADRAPLRVGVVLSSERVVASAARPRRPTTAPTSRSWWSATSVRCWSRTCRWCAPTTRVLWFTRALVSQAEAAGITVVGVRAARRSVQRRSRWRRSAARLPGQ